MKDQRILLDDFFKRTIKVFHVSNRIRFLNFFFNFTLEFLFYGADFAEKVFCKFENSKDNFSKKFNIISTNLDSYRLIDNFLAIV